MHRTSGGRTTLLILDRTKSKVYVWKRRLELIQKENEERTRVLPVDCVLPVDVRSGSLISLETPAVIISTPSLSPLASRIICSSKARLLTVNGMKMKLTSTHSVWGSGMTLWGLTFMASALWVMRRCHLVHRQQISLVVVSLTTAVSGP